MSGKNYVAPELALGNVKRNVRKMTLNLTD